MYIGRKFNFILDEIKKTNDDFKFFNSYEFNILKSLNEILNPIYSKVMIELDSLDNNNDEILSALKQLKRLNDNLSLGIIAIGYPNKSEFINNIREIGFYNVYATLDENNTTAIKDFIYNFYFEDITNEIDNILQNTELFNLTKKLDESFNEAPVEVKQNTITIGLLGSQKNIGTTTQALQIAKFLQHKNFSSCYIELNTTNYVDNVKELYNTLQDENGHLVYNNISLFNHAEDIPYIKNNFQYCIVDYGYLAKDTYIPSFLEKDIKICVCGFKPNEFLYFKKLLKIMYKYDDVHYIFSFIAKSEQNEILNLFKESNKNIDYVHFADFSPDPFVFNPGTNTFYKNIINNISEISTSKISKKNKKFNIFKRK